MPLSAPDLARRNRLIVLAAKEGHSYMELARTYGITRQLVSIICTRAGYRRRPELTPEAREKIWKTRRQPQPPST